MSESLTLVATAAEVGKSICAAQAARGRVAADWPGVGECGVRHGAIS